MMPRGGSLSSLTVGDYYRDDPSYGNGAAVQQSNPPVAAPAMAQSEESPQAVITAVVVTMGILIAVRILWEVAEG